MSVGGEEVGVVSTPDIRSRTQCRCICELFLGNTPNPQIWCFLNWIYLQEEGKLDIRWENSKKDPSNYHSLTSIIRLYNTFGRKGEHRCGDKHKASCQYPNLNRDYLLNVSVSHWSSSCSWLCSSPSNSWKTQKQGEHRKLKHLIM